MRTRLFSIGLILAALTAPISGASAQTANGTPTAPVSGGAGGAASTAGSSTGGMRAKPKTSKIGAPTPTEQQEEAKSNKDMSICKGC